MAGYSKRTISRILVNNAVNASQANTAGLATSASYAITASYALNVSGGIGGGGTPGGSNTQIQYNSASVFAGVPVLTYNGTTLTGTGSFSGSFIGILTGTSSWATNALTASYFSGNAISASYATFAVTASFLSGSVTSASYALSASYAEKADKINVLDASTSASLFYPVIVDDVGNMVPYLDADFSYTPSTNQLTVGGITSSLFGTASWAGSVLTASYVNPLKQDVSVTGSVNITGSFGLYSFGPTAPVSTPSRVGLFYFTDTDFYISLD